MTRIALVTGAGAGIGKACCIRLAKQGVAVGVLGRNILECEEVVDQIASAGGSAIALRADITSREDVRAAIEQLRATLGPVTILVNNAGVSDVKAFEDLTEPDWRRMLEVNVIGTFAVTQACLPDMKTTRWGRIVNVSSSSAQSGSALQVHYAASKGALIAMTRSLAHELGPWGITVNTIPPGAVLNTKMSEVYRQRISPEMLANRLPVRRTGIPEDVAAACSWLVSEDAGYVTGQTIGVNGGRVMQ